jgi:hypothetical protein
MMKQLINLVFVCTDREALNLAIFLHETFILLELWRVCFCFASSRLSVLLERENFAKNHFFQRSVAKSGKTCVLYAMLPLVCTALVALGGSHSLLCQGSPRSDLLEISKQTAGGCPKE